MSIPQNDYAGRLPYGYWFGPEQGREYLFDRGYGAIASRPIDEPWRVEVYAVHTFMDAGPGRLEERFYSDRTSPRVNKTTLVICERVLSRFVSGRDVRAWLLCNADRKPLPGLLAPKTRGRYLPEEIPRKTMERHLVDPAERRPRPPTVDDLLS